MPKNFVKVQGQELVLSGKSMVFRGLGIGSWLNLEHFMVGLPSPDGQIRRAVTRVFGQETASAFFQSLAECFVTEKDFEFLRACGVNVLRVPFNYRLFLDDQEPGRMDPQGFALFDRLLDLCEQHGIYLLPDLHAVPGGQNPDWHSDNDTGIPQFWQYAAFRRQMVELWGQLAARWKDREYLLGYDLLNEPWLMDAPDGLLMEFYRDAAAAIRQVDRNHIIFLEGDHFAMNFDCIQTLDDPNTALTFHFYPTVWEPELLNISYGREERQRKFQKILDEIISCRRRLNRPVFCGEAGYENCKLGPEFSMELLRETIALFERNGVSWTIWSYKDARFMGMCCPKADSPWMELAGRIGCCWDQDVEKAQANALMEVIAQFPSLRAADTELKYRMQFRQRGILFVFQVECILKPALSSLTKEQLLELPRSFLLENCDQDQGFVSVIKAAANCGREC